MTSQSNVISLSSSNNDDVLPQQGQSTSTTTTFPRKASRVLLGEDDLDFVHVRSESSDQSLTESETSNGGGGFPLFDGDHSPANIAAYAGLLGLGAGVGFTWGAIGSTANGFGYFLGGLCGFHMLEYVSTSMYHPHKVSLDSFLLNHSWQYHLAMGFGAAEYWIEYLLFPSMKRFRTSNLIGVGLMLSFQALRTSAMITAGSNFTHLVAYSKKPDHKLVQHGVYKYIRHPSYTGFFYWAVFMQSLVLSNPLAATAYAFALYKFFRERICEEELLLTRFFGAKYEAYKKRSWKCLIPFI